ncbi:SWIM zinc finger family protein, partial [bacterium]|nr:SWIM zinc finger family protein [bacterium]
MKLNTMQKYNFTKMDIKNKSTNTSYYRGEDLFYNKTVSNVKIENNIIMAKVLGSRLYSVEIRFLKDELQFACSCPYDFGGICKHCVALALEIIDVQTNILDEIDLPADEKDEYDIGKLFTMANKDQITHFLKEILENDHTLFKKFENRLKGQENTGSDFSIDEDRDEIKELFEDFDLSDYTRFYDSDPDTTCGGYRDEWEILSDGANQELSDLFDNIYIDIEHSLSTENVIDAVKGILALYEGISVANLQDIPDEACIYDGELSTEVFEIFQAKYTSFVEIFSKIKINENASKRLIDLIFKRVRAYSEDNHFDFLYNLKLFNPIFFTILSNKNSALYLKNILSLSKIPIAESEDILLRIHELIDDKSEWLKIAEQGYKTNPDIAKKLLFHYEGDNANFLRISTDIAFQWHSRFIPYLYEQLNKSDDRILYKQISIQHAKDTQDISVYLKFKEDYGVKEAGDFID